MNQTLRAIPLLILGLVVAGCAGGGSDKTKQANIHRRVGEGYLAQRQISRAISEFQKGIEINPKNAELQQDLGLAFLLRQEFDKSETYLRRAIELDGSLSEARNHLAVVYLAQDRPAEALDQLEAALKDKNFVSTGLAYFNQGKAYLMLGQPQSAIVAFESSIERNPSDIRPYLELSDLHLKQKNLRKAAFAARRAIEFYPADYRAWFMLGRALQAQNDETGAIEAFQKTRQTAPESSEEFVRAGSFLKLLRNK